LQIFETRKEFETKKYSLLCFGPNLAQLSSSLLPGEAQLGPVSSPLHPLPPSAEAAPCLRPVPRLDAKIIVAAAVGYKSQVPPSRRTLARHSSPLFLSLPSSFPSPLSFSLPHVKLTVTEARRLAPPYRDLPSPAVVLRRSATSSSTSPLKESSRRALNRRRSRRFLAGNRGPSLPNSPPPAVLRPNRDHRRPQGECPVRPPPFPLRFSCRSAVPGRPSPVTGSWSCWALLSRPGQPGLPCGPRAPLVIGPGSKDPGYKKFCYSFLISENFRI
jgi:hypothetical protein